MLLTCESSVSITHASLASRPCRAFLRGTFAGRGMRLPLPAKMRTKICGVYRFVHNKTGNCYIGSAKDIHARRNDHIRKTAIGSKRHFHRCLRELGIENFTFEILEVCSADVRFEREAYFIALHNSVYPNGFNLVSDPTKSWNGMFTDVILARIADGQKNRIYSAEMREERRVRMLGNKYSLGMKHTEEHKLKCLVKRLGSKRSAETKAKMSASQTGKKLSAEHKAKVGRANKMAARKRNLARYGMKIEVRK